jgi:NAD kinase
VVVTKKTRLQELLERFVTEAQARFYIEHMGLSFSDYENAHSNYTRILKKLQNALPETPRHMFMDRTFLPTFSFFEKDLIIVIGNNGLIVNTAKYLDGQPIMGINADPDREEGILARFEINNIGHKIQQVLLGNYQSRWVTMAKASLNDGQELLGFNDLFIGHKSHVSARYRIRHNGTEEDHSSSGIIVSTGAGSTGWMKSILTGAVGIASRVMKGTQKSKPEIEIDFDWSANHLLFAVREPWPSITTQTGMVFGWVNRDQPLQVISYMPEGGVIFSDGVEQDALAFNSGAIATIGLAEKKANIITSIR